jgi:hypothetical protein
LNRPRAATVRPVQRLRLSVYRKPLACTGCEAIRPPGSLAAVPWDVTLLLADAAQAVDNKLYVLGGGWSITGPQPSPSALAIHLKVPWDEANQRHQVRIQLLDADGQPVTVGEGDQAQPLVVEGEFEVGRPAAGLIPGTPIDLSLAITLSPLPLAPGARYEWRLSIDGHHDEDWRVAFSTRAG